MSPASAQGPAAPMLEQPAPPAEEKKEGAPTTCGPLISDTCLPIETYHASVQVLWAASIYRNNLTPNWRQTDTKGDFATFLMPVKFTYGPSKDMEMYVVIPYIYNFAGSLNASIAGPHGERSADYGGIGDITLVGKYNFLPEGDIRPAVTGVLGTIFPTGHASNLNPRFLGTDAVGSGAFTFITGVNLFKYIKPFLVHGQIWLNTPVNLHRLTSANDSVRSRESLTVNLATKLPLNKRWVLLCEVYSTWTWENIYTVQGYQSPFTVVGVLPGIEFLATDKWSFATGCAFDLWGKGPNATAKITPMFTVYRSF
jgi:hypothetical protein